MDVFVNNDTYNLRTIGKLLIICSCHLKCMCNASDSLYVSILEAALKLVEGSSILEMKTTWTAAKL